MTILNRSLIAAPAAALFLLASCGSPEAPNAQPEAPAADSAAQAATYSIDTAASTVDWKGTMVGVKSHTGTLHFVNGEVSAQGGAITGGSFTVDMRSYTFTDTNYAKPGSAQGTRMNLMQHLMAPDFFAVDSFPTAQFTITSVNGNSATGEMTIRGRKGTETVQNIVLTADGNTFSATGDLTFDRQKYGVSWKSPMQDMVLSDDIVLHIELTGAAR